CGRQYQVWPSKPGPSGAAFERATPGGRPGDIGRVARKTGRRRHRTDYRRSYFIAQSPMSLAPVLDRSAIERIVREIVLKQTATQTKPELVVSVSARHVHLTDEHVEILFGKGRTLTPMKPL